jgi:hypothetical protein
MKNIDRFELVFTRRFTRDDSIFCSPFKGKNCHLERNEVESRDLIGIQVKEEISPFQPTASSRKT